MTVRSLAAAAAVAVAVLLAAPAWAQLTATGAFAELSPGNQKIAQALFDAQRTNGTTRTPLTRDQIAALKGTEGWGRVFKQMKADGLVQARNLGQVVSGREHQLHAAATSTGSRTSVRSGGISRSR